MTRKALLRVLRAALALPGLLAPGVLMLACVTSAGCNDCDFHQRCAGDVVEQCGGSDQVIGRGVIRKPCGGLNPHCVEASDKEAFCASTKQRSCTSPTSHCESRAILVKCDRGFDVTTDCSAIVKSVPGGGTVSANLICNGNGSAEFPADCYDAIN
jgi:hypothetical protein